MSYALTTPDGTVEVSSAALQQLVVRAVGLADGVRVRRPRRGLELRVEDGRARVSLALAVRYGERLPEVARAAQERVAEALSAMCGLEVVAVDVSVEELYP